VTVSCFHTDLPNGAAPPELHIASLVVHSTPSGVDRVAGVIAAIPGAQVHASSPTGKLVVTLEASSTEEMMAKVSGIQRARDVVSAALVYQCADTLDAMNEELPHGDH
jgi:nitrate reductase NapD